MLRWSLRFARWALWAALITCASMPASADNLVTYYTTDPDTKGLKPPGQPGHMWTQGGLISPPQGAQIDMWFAALNNQNASLKKYMSVDLSDTGNTTGNFGDMNIQEFTGIKEPTGTVGGTLKKSTSFTEGQRKKRHLDFEFASQPAWERLRITIKATGPSQFVIAMNAVCQIPEKKPQDHRKITVNGGSMGATGPGAMSGPQHIRQIMWFPNNEPIDQNDTPSGTFPPASGNWTASLIGTDPDGNPRPMGGVLYETLGPGLVPGDPWQLEFGLATTADDFYDMYAYDVDDSSYESYLVDVRDVPTAVPVGGWATDLRGAVTNPARSVPIVHFTLANGGAVRLDLFDLSGRLVASRVDDWAAGPHDVALGRPDLPAGLYWVRMWAAGVSSTRRIAVLR